MPQIKLVKRIENKEKDRNYKITIVNMPFLNVENISSNKIK